MVNVVSFSGGKDSTAMLLLMIEKNIKIDEIIMCDTGMEFQDMYNHINKIKENIKYPITVLKADNSFEFYMFNVIKQKGKNKGKCGYSWPDFRNRWCTQLLKKSVIKKYLNEKYREKQVIEYQGIAADEVKRLNKNKEKNIKYPLAEWGMTEQDCLNYCYSKGYDWNGLYKKLKRVSCWCCPLKSLFELEVIYNDFPEYWKKLKEFDKNTYRKFRADYSIEDLERKFIAKNNEPDLF
ncbi:MAG: phosphoadenosine phosphosulfate reductase family protein [Crenarchaeota archaeon]|nr:phosphoadenosine phosphosulfate reductase family protein [Thermoproteota archaeon]